MPLHSSLRDSPNSFGWLSITMHWLSAIAVVLLWFVGKSIVSVPADQIDARRELHVLMGLVLWLPLALRIIWRVRVGHPHAEGLKLRQHRLARGVHLLLLALLALMLVTGPVMAWFLPERNAVTSAALFVHSNTAMLLFAMVILHVMAALKHLMFHDDESVARIFLPRRQ